MSKFVINSKEVTKDFWEQNNTGIVVFVSPKTGHSTRHKAGNNFPGLDEIKESRVSDIRREFNEFYANSGEKLIFNNLEYSNKEIQASIKNVNAENSQGFQQATQDIGTKLQQDTVVGTRLVSDTVGIKHSEGKTPMELDFDFIKQMAERMASNKSNGKYKPFNWKSAIDVRSLKDAVMRHMLEIMEGRYEDDGREFGHIEAAATGLMMINYQLKHK